MSFLRRSGMAPPSAELRRSASSRQARTVRDRVSRRRRLARPAARLLRGGDGRHPAPIRSGRRRSDRRIARGAPLAALPHPPRLRHGAGRRRDAADGIRPFDHRVEPRHRHAPAARRGGLAGGIRALPAKPAIRSPEPGHEPAKLSRPSIGGSGRIASSAASSGSSTSPAFSGSRSAARCRGGCSRSSPAMGVLLGAQGVVGWIMVASGLEPGMTAVEPVRLALHLTLACLFFAALVALYVRLGGAEREAGPARRAVCGARARRSRLRADRARRAGRRARRRPHLQHLAADGRPLRPARARACSSRSG